jgi:hypothetical protein
MQYNVKSKDNIVSQHPLEFLSSEKAVEFLEQQSIDKKIQELLIAILKRIG